MKEKNTLHTYNTEDHDDAPIWSDDDFANAVHRVGLKPVGKKLKINLLESAEQFRDFLQFFYFQLKFKNPNQFLS